MDHEREPVPSPTIPPDIEAEVLRLTRQFDAADRDNDQRTQLDVLEKLTALPGK